MNKMISMLLFTLLSTAACAEGIDFFHGSFEQALEKAESEGKLVYVDVYTDWCGPCEQMAREVFPLDEVGAFYNKHFISLKLDAEDEEMNGPELAEKFEIKAYPTGIFLNGKGEIQREVVGAMDANGMLVVGKSVTGKLVGPEKFAEEYDTGNRKPKFIRSYLTTLWENSHNRNKKSQAAAEGMARVAGVYFTENDPESVLTKEDFELVQKIFKNHTRKTVAVDFVARNYSGYAKVVDTNELSDFIVESNYRTMDQLARSGDITYKDYLADISGELAPAYRVADIHPMQFKYMRLMLDKSYHQHHKSWEAYLSCVEKLDEYHKGKQPTWRAIDELIANTNDIDLAIRAEKLMRPAYEAKKEPIVSLIYAELLLYMDQVERGREILIEEIMKAPDENGSLKRIKIRGNKLLAQRPTLVGKRILNFESMDVEGNTIALNDILPKHKYVLVELWASWCGPCRSEIPHLKQAYSKYHDKGFEIFSYSLDDDEDAWKEAVEEEEMAWVNVSDFKAYESPVCKQFDVKGIPANYLVDSATGKVVIANLRGRQLEEKLQELLTPSK